MFRLRFMFLVLVVAVCAGRATAQSPSYVPNQLIVSFWDEDSRLMFPDSAVAAAAPQLDSILQRHGLQQMKALFGPRSVLRNVFQLTFREEVDLDRVEAELSSFPGVKNVTRNRIGTVCGNVVPNDYAFNHDWTGDGKPDQYHLFYEQVDKAWNITTGDSSVVVCILDTGIDYGHVDLHGVIWQNVGDGGITSWGEDADMDGHTLEWDESTGEWVLDPGGV